VLLQFSFPILFSDSFLLNLQERGYITQNGKAFPLCFCPLSYTLSYFSQVGRGKVLLRKYLYNYFFYLVHDTKQTKCINISFRYL
jgi:hypothetical protein